MVKLSCHGNKHPQDTTMVIRYKDVPTDIVKASSLSQQIKDQHNLIKCVGG